MDRDYEEELGEVEELGEQEEQNAEQFAQRLPERRKEEPPPPTEVDSKKKLKGKRKKQLPPIRINLSACKYEVLRIVQRKLGWKEVGDDEDWELYWTDTSVSIERIMKLTRVQKINHFSGMLEICRKRAMARNLMKMARHFPQHYDFFPRTFTLPTDREEFMADIRSRGKKQVYILKPDAGCQGRGIRLVQGGKEEVVTRVLNEMATPNIVAQHYLVNPLLIHGYKFDLRIYALVLSCDPMRVFLFHEGLARFCTEKYSPPKASNLDVAFMHLTNYAVNKKNEAFVAASAANDEEGDASKWCLAQLKHYINSTGHSYDQVWGDIADLIIKSLCSVQPILRNNYRSVLPPDNDGFSCFEILGYDVMLDDAYRPWLIEVNHSPSFNIDSPLDLTIKEELITQTIELVRVDPKLIAKTKKAERRAATSRLLEPMHVKKAPPVRSGGPLGGAGGAGGGAGAGGGGAGAGAAGGGDKGEARDKGEREKGGGGTGAGDGEEASAGPGAGAAQSAAQSAAFVKPRTPEEYEAWRAKVLAARERYEAKHSGNFTRIFPSPDPAKQALYEELLKGANEVYQASFQARSKPAPSDDKKRKEDTETESQKAERLKQRALRDKLAQMAVERRRIKAQQQAQQQQAQQAQQPPLPAYLNPPPYMGPMGAGPYAPGGYPPGQLTAQPPHYVPLMPAGYQYDAALLYQQYHQQYGGGARGSEVYGERSDGAGSAASSRPVSALSTGGPAQDYLASAVQQHMQAAGGRLYSGHVARSAAGAGGNGGGSRSGSPANGGRTSAHHQHPHQVSAAQLLAHHQQQQQLALNQQLQTQGALPPHPFLGAPRRPASAASRAGGGGGAGGTAGASEGGDWPGTGAGLGPDLVATGRGASASGARAASPAPGFAPGGPAGGGGAGGAGRALGVGAVSGSGGADRAALLQLQQLQQAAAALSHPHPGGAVSAAGSARGHVRHAHSSALEAAGAAGERYPDLGSGSGEAGYGPGPGRGLGLTGSRPPSASASLRDKLQPGAAGATAAAVAAAALASVGVAGSHKHLAAAFWDGGMGAASTAAGGHDGGTAMPHLNSRPRPLSAGNGLRPTSSGGARRSPSPLGGLPPPLVGTGGGGYTSADMHLLGMLGHAPHMLMPQGMGGPGPGPLMVGPVASSKLIRSTSNPPAPTSPGSGTLPAAAGALAAPGSAGEGPGAASSSGRVYKTARAPAAVPLALTARGAASQALRRGEDDYLPTDDGSGPGVMYQPLSMPDAGAGPPPGMAYGGGPGAGGGAGRHWSAASHAGAQRQRSFTSGSTSGAAAAAAAAAAAGSGAAGHGGVSGAGPGTRLPVYPAPGGSPGMRPGGGPGSGRAGGGSPAGVGKGGPSGAAARLNTALAAAASGPGAHAVGLGYATGPGRAGGAGMVAGVGVGVGALQAGIEGLSFTAAGLSPGLDLDSQLRNAALASLNRKALTVTGRRVAQQ